MRVQDNIEYDEKGNVKIGISLICPVCNKKFQTTSETKFLIGGGFTCCWKCFLNYASKKKSDKKIISNQKNCIYNPITQSSISTPTVHKTNRTKGKYSEIVDKLDINSIQTYYKTHSGAQTAQKYNISEQVFWYIADKFKLRK